MHAAEPALPTRGRRRLLPLALLVVGAAIAAYVGGKAPRQQHVRFVLGASATAVTGLDLQYVGEGGEPVREAHLAFELGRAPRVVSHDPSLPDGPYRLRIDVDTREGRRSGERQVTLGGGTTSVDLSRVIEPEPISP